MNTAARCWPCRPTVSDVAVTHSACSHLLAPLPHVHNEVVELGDRQRDIVLATRERATRERDTRERGTRERGTRERGTRERGTRERGTRERDTRGRVGNKARVDYYDTRTHFVYNSFKHQSFSYPFS